MKQITLILIAIFSVISLNAKTLIVYYSFSNNTHNIVNELVSQINADVIRIEPAVAGLDYAANNYAIGSALISAIRNNPTNASSYPAIMPTSVDLSEYETIIVATPLWWSNMAALMQTFLFNYGSQMAGKNIALIVSSASSGISGVEADANRLIPNGNFLVPSLWIRSSQTANSQSLISDWLSQINYQNITGVEGINSDLDIEIFSSKGQLQIRGEFNSLTLFDESGKSVLQTSEKDINTNAIRSGIYIVSINKSNQVLNRKIYINN